MKLVVGSVRGPWRTWTLGAGAVRSDSIQHCSQDAGGMDIDWNGWRHGLSVDRLPASKQLEV